MKYAIFFTLAILAIASAERHAIIIAPRANWPDYGVQSESCRMYKDLVAGGVKPENIVLMSTKEVSEMAPNPYPGELFTDDSPYAPGKDYAHGCVEYIDYNEKEMTGSVMMAIMRGDAKAVKQLTGKENPKVLHSTEDDNVMMYFTSHGSPGSILVGYGTVSDIELMETIKFMHDHKMYKNFLFLMEACYSGSMFRDLPKSYNVYAITAADNQHPSYESHCPPNDVINQRDLATCLSCYWDNSMEWFMEGGADHTLDELFKHTHEAVAKSSSQNVSHFGDIEGMGKMTLRQFMGDLPAKRLRSMAEDKSEKISKSEVPKHLAMWRAIRADKSELAEAMKQYEEEVFKMAKKEVEVMRLGRAVMSEKAAEKAMKMPAGEYSIDCVKELTLSLMNKCGHTLPFSESAMNMLRNICLPGLSMPNVDMSEICMYFCLLSSSIFGVPIVEDIML